MNKRINLILAATLLGGVMTMLPAMWKVLIFTGIALVLYISYDEWDYSQRVGGVER